jgi:uncharacterized tellurite resistance protein B-like protein
LINFIKSLLDASLTQEPNQDKKLSLATSVYALLIEVAKSDQDFSDSEKEHIDTMCARYFGLSEEEVLEVETAAKRELEQAIDLYHLTKDIRQNFTVEERTEILEMIWAIVYTDGKIDPYEEQLTRRLCDLIGLQHQHYMQAKKSASQKGKNE